jgi:hypothetical protein
VDDAHVFPAVLPEVEADGYEPGVEIVEGRWSGCRRVNEASNVHCVCGVPSRLVACYLRGVGVPSG